MSDPAAAQAASAGYGPSMADIAKFFHDLWITADPLKPDDVEAGLWNAHVRAANYEAGEERYRAAILEQYKIYVEMADRISARRSLANTFFLTLNTAVLTAVGVFWNKQPGGSEWALLVLLIVLLGQCLTWYWLIRGYRQLNTGKYTVIAALERQLPATPYWGGEWAALGEGKDRTRYWPLTHIEQGVPALVAAAYVSGFVLLVI
jgi:hypothetical protein